MKTYLNYWSMYFGSRAARSRRTMRTMQIPVAPSTGTMMALHTGLRRPALALIVGFSGVLVTPTNQEVAAAAASEITVKPPVLLVHGDQDEVIPAQALFLSAQGLGGMGLTVEWHLSQGIGHGIDGDGLRLGGAFLHKAFGGR